MALSRFVTTAIAASTLASVVAAFDAQAKTNVAVYYVYIPRPQSVVCIKIVLTSPGPRIQSTTTEPLLSRNIAGYHQPWLR